MLMGKTYYYKIKCAEGFGYLQGAPSDREGGLTSMSKTKVAMLKMTGELPLWQYVFKYEDTALELAAYWNKSNPEHSYTLNPQHFFSGAANEI